MITVMQQANNAAKVAMQQKQGHLPNNMGMVRVHTANPTSQSQQRALTSSGAGMFKQPMGTAAVVGNTNQNPR